MVNQVLARRYWPNEEPIGKRIRIATASSSFFEVIGGARHRGCERIVQHRPPDSLCAIRASKANFFKGVRTETPPYQMQFLIRTSGDPARVKAALRREALAQDGSLRVHIQTVGKCESDDGAN